MSLTGHTSEVTSLSFSASADLVFSGSQGGTVYVWDLKTQKELTKLRGHLTSCTCLYGEEANGALLATGSDDTNVKLWDYRVKSKDIITFKEHTRPITCV